MNNLQVTFTDDGILITSVERDDSSEVKDVQHADLALLAAGVRSDSLSAIGTFLTHHHRRLHWAMEVAIEASTEHITQTVWSMPELKCYSDEAGEADPDGIVQASFEAGYLSAIKDMATRAIAIPVELANAFDAHTVREII